jgi:hypothetical protein
MAGGGFAGKFPRESAGDDGLLEIKAPLPHTQVEYWLSGEVGERFRPQLQGQLYISQRRWVDILCGTMCCRNLSCGSSPMKSSGAARASIRTTWRFACGRYRGYQGRRADRLSGAPTD